MCKLATKKRIIRPLHLPLLMYDVIFNALTTSHFLSDRMFLHQVYSLILSCPLITEAVTSHFVITVGTQIVLYS